MSAKYVDSNKLTSRDKKSNHVGVQRSGNFYNFYMDFIVTHLYK